jgi:hypothetical protein
MTGPELLQSLVITVALAFCQDRAKDSLPPSDSYAGRPLRSNEQTRYLTMWLTGSDPEDYI